MDVCRRRSYYCSFIDIVIVRPDQIDSGIQFVTGQHLSLLHFTMLSSMRGEVLFVAVVMTEVALFPGLVGGA